jgi:hypothetical protein
LHRIVEVFEIYEFLDQESKEGIEAVIGVTITGYIPREQVPVAVLYACRCQGSYIYNGVEIAGDNNFPVKASDLPSNECRLALKIQQETNSLPEPGQQHGL